MFYVNLEYIPMPNIIMKFLQKYFYRVLNHSTSKVQTSKLFYISR